MFARSAEAIRRTVRALVGRTGIYRQLSRAAEYLAVIRREGRRTWRTLSTLRAGAGSSDEITALKFRNLEFPFSIRAHPEDVTIAINTVIREEWGQLEDVGAPRWMVDAGAYIGDTAAYFLSRFPTLNVIALEPHPKNFELASLNLEPYGNRARLLNVGLWSSDGQLGMAGAFTSTVLRPAALAAMVDVVSVPTLLTEYSISELDLLKMDIEGAESDVLSADADAWLPRVRSIILEIHSPEAIPILRTTLGRHGFQMRQFRSVWYCQRIDPQ